MKIIARRNSSSIRVEVSENHSYYLNSEADARKYLNRLQEATDWLWRGKQEETKEF